MKNQRLFIILVPGILYTGMILGMLVFRSGWFAILSYHAGICLSLSLTRQWPARRAILSGWRPLIGLALLLAGLAAGPVIFVLWRFMHLPSTTARAALSGMNLTGLSLITFMIYYSTVNPWLEEIFWRQAYAKAIRRRWLSEILYAGYHVFILILMIKTIWVAVAFGVLCAIGWTWRKSAETTGGLLVPGISHMIADTSIILSIWLLSVNG